MNKKAKYWILFVIAILICFSCKSFYQGKLNGYLVKKGKVNYEIVIDENANRMVFLAAKELQEYMYKITGKSSAIVSTESKKKYYKIYIGNSKYTRNLNLVSDTIDSEGFLMKSGQNWIALLGKDKLFIPKEPFSYSRNQISKTNLIWDKLTNANWRNPLSHTYKAYNRKLGIWESDGKGSLNAVNEFLRMQGIRWYLPGDIGEIVPKSKSILFPKLDTIVIPDFKYRNISFLFKRFNIATENEVKWYLRLGLYTGAEEIGLAPLGHGITNVHSRREVKMANPKYFALINGERDTKTRLVGKPCLSSQELFNDNIKFCQAYFDIYDEPAISVMPPDSYDEFCECDLCAGKDTPQRGYNGKLSDYVWTYVNNLSKELLKSHPEKKIMCFAFSSYLYPPEDIEILSPNLIVGLCRKRSKFIISKEQEKDSILMSNWLDKIPSKKIITWDYYLDSQSRSKNNRKGIPVVFPHIISKDIQNLSNKVIGEFIEVYREQKKDNLLDIATNHINIYVTSRLYWNNNQNVDEILEEYYTKFYGPASKEMKSFFEFSEKNWGLMKRGDDKFIFARQYLENALFRVDSNTDYRVRINLIKDYLTHSNI